eukprot:1158448-Pelagomonas_calceolata.AAC.4
MCPCAAAYVCVLANCFQLHFDRALLQFKELCKHAPVKDDVYLPVTQEKSTSFAVSVYSGELAVCIEDMFKGA